MKRVLKRIDIDVGSVPVLAVLAILGLYTKSRLEITKHCHERRGGPHSHGRIFD